MPFSCRRQVGIGTLALRHVCFPLGLSGQFCQPCHIAFPIKFIHRVTNHKYLCSITIELHFDNPDFALSGNDFGPNVGVDVAVFFDEFGVVDEFQSLTITFHNEIVFSRRIRRIMGSLPVD